VIRQGENSLKGLETLQKILPFAPCATSYGMEWEGLHAVRYRESTLNGEYSTSSVTSHLLSLDFRRPEKLDWRCGGIKRESPSATCSIAAWEFC
jgi:hypothetical protein